MNKQRLAYSTDLSDEDWNELASFFPDSGNMGRPRENTFREIMNGICYINRAGCAWELLPHDLPHYKTVYHYFNQWAKEGLFERINFAFVPVVRQMEGRKAEPTAGIIDSQTARTVQVQAGEKGWDGNKKQDGRKRHILVDVLGLLLKVVVQPANLPDHKGAEVVIAKAKQTWQQIVYIWADGIYKTKALTNYLIFFFGIVLSVVKSIKYDSSKKEITDDNQPLLLDFEDLEHYEFTEAEKKRGFKILRQRYKVERTISWMCKNRRLSKDYEVLPEIEESFCYLAMIRIMLNRINCVNRS